MSVKDTLLQTQPFSQYRLVHREAHGSSFYFIYIAAKLMERTKALAYSKHSMKQTSWNLIFNISSLYYNIVRE